VKILVACAVAVLSAREASAAPKKVLVLKLDGTADPAERERLQNEVARLAREGDVVVTLGNTTLAETASAVGCDPAAPACIETVRQTLGVDELVYGTATENADHKVELEVHHPPQKDERATVAPGEPVSFGGPVVPDKLAPVSFDAPAVDHRQRNYAIAAIAGGGVAVLIGLTLWSQESSTQDAIDKHATMTTAQLLDLKQLEDQASSYGWYGNAMMVIGLGLGGVGAYLLYRDHGAHQVVVAPAPGGVAIGGVW
jgi:threonine dehydrogenase-like Zn-dependent dehydrogenase